MPLTFNLRDLEDKDLHLQGKLPVADLELEGLDELVHVREPLRYDLQVHQLDQAVLVQGRLSLPLQCECSRCLKPFPFVLDLENWACHVPLEGEEAVLVMNDTVDLTPQLREDILLTFPQHPLCEAECSGLKKPPSGKAKTPGRKSSETASPWAELNKLKLKD